MYLSTSNYIFIHNMKISLNIASRPIHEVSVRKNIYFMKSHVTFYIYLCIATAEGQDEVVAVLGNWYLLFVDLGLILNQGYK